TIPGAPRAACPVHGWHPPARDDARNAATSSPRPPARKRGRRTTAADACQRRGACASDGLLHSSFQHRFGADAAGRFFGRKAEGTRDGGILSAIEYLAQRFIPAVAQNAIVAPEGVRAIAAPRRVGRGLREWMGRFRLAEFALVHHPAYGRRRQRESGGVT